jgi:hypothetical protein
MGKCRTPRYTVRTSEIGPEPPHVRTGPLEWDPDPPYVVRATHSGVPRFQDRTHPGLRSGANTCLDLVWWDPDLSAYTLAPRSGGDPMLLRGILRAA